MGILGGVCQCGLLHGAMNGPSNEATPSDDQHAYEAQNCSNSDEDGAFRESRMLHERCICCWWD